MDYKEHEKLRAVQEKSQACGEFLEWLTGPQGFTIGEYHTHSEECYDKKGKKECGTSTEELYPVSINVRKMLAQFFEIDETKLEEEKRAMLAELAPKAKTL